MRYYLCFLGGNMELCQNCGQPIEAEGFRPKKFCNDQCRYDFHNKKKKKWTLKKLAKHYQEAGEYLPEAQALEEIHIMSIAQEIEEKYLNKRHNLCFNDEFGPKKLEHLISIEIGSWQATHGFCCEWKRIKEELDKK